MSLISNAIFCVILVIYSATSFGCEKLSVNGADGWYPYFARQNPEHLGIMGDIVTKAANRASIKIDLRPSIPWKRILFNLRNGKLDIIAGALKTQQREKQFKFSPAVHHAELRVFVRRDQSFDYQQLSDLRGKHGAKVRGMSLGQEADKYAFDNLVVDDAPSPKSLFQMVASGRLDYGIFYWSTGKKEVNKRNLSAIIDILPTPVSKEGLYIAFSKNSPCQHQIESVNNEIRRMKEDGSVESIIQYYHSAIASQEMEVKND